MIHQALLMAVRAHQGQLREGEYALPYVTHPIEVASILRSHGVRDVNVLAAALLHDVLEESAVESCEILSITNDRVLELVTMLTRTEIEGATYEVRTAQFLIEIETRMDEDAWQIKLADRISNFRLAKVTRPPKKLARYTAQTQEILKRIPRSVNLGIWDELQRLL